MAEPSTGLPAALLLELRQDLGPLSVSVADRIRSEVPGYAQVDPEVHLTGVEGQLRAILDGLIAHTLPCEEDVAQARALGASRARMGVRLPDVIDAYHIAYPAIWTELRGRVARSSAVEDSSLLAEVEFVWRWLHILSAAVAEAHAAETSSRSAIRAEHFRQLLVHLRSNPVDAHVAANLLERLDFDHRYDLTFARTHGLSQSQIDGLVVDQPTAGQVMRGTVEADEVTLLAQGFSAAGLIDALNQCSDARLVGIGRPASGPVGAAASLQDAQDALSRSRHTGRPVSFEDEWFICGLEGSRERLAPFVADAVAIAHRHPHIALAVIKFAESNFAVSQCARALHIHANSARYRLDRWKKLTGWDPMCFEGLQKSMLALDRSEGANSSSMAE
ncbi:helix-turn-helix domain-containing protein [Streptomyces sp. CLV115]|uniref:PucR family transcriptional regulator n=1 Tax=Streptomyces sp. CLV115 TaxID=3138502 RepID=UPI00313BFCC5